MVAMKVYEVLCRVVVNRCSDVVSARLSYVGSKAGALGK